MLRTALLIVAALSADLLAHEPLEAAILINEVLADPAADADGDGIAHAIRDEFIELVNTGTAAQSLTGWTISDLAQVRHAFGDAAVIPGHGFFLVFGSTASGGSLGLNNTGDTISLWDDAAELVQVVTYGGEGGQDASLTRFPDAAGPFTLHTSVSQASFSPGRTVDGQAYLPHEEPPGPDRAPVIPEPASSFLMMSGLLGVGLTRKQK